LSAIATAGARNAASLVGGGKLGAMRVVADEDADDIVQQVRRNIAPSGAARAEDLDGRWMLHGRSSPVVVLGGALQSACGEPEQPITTLCPGKFSMLEHGHRLEGELVVENEIHWSSGAVWIRVQDTHHTQVSKRSPSAPLKQLARSASEATWDRQKPENAEEKFHPQSGAIVRGRYVFNPGADAQVLAGQSQRAPSHGDAAGGLASSHFSPRLVPGGGARAKVARGATRDCPLPTLPASCRQPSAAKAIPVLAEDADDLRDGD